MSQVRIKTALLSVSDKSELMSLVKVLTKFDVSMMSTGGTFKLIDEAGIEVTEVADHTGFPEMMDGRVKTLHPKIHGGLLGRRGELSAVDDSEVMLKHGITAIDLLVVNLYPFENSVARDPKNLAEAIENIDIGGPAMLRSGAKNLDSVVVIVDKDDYAPIIEELETHAGSISQKTRHRLAVKAFAHVAKYDAAISNYLSAYDKESQLLEEFPATLTLQFTKKQTMRYGENPHQSAAFYTDLSEPMFTVAQARQLQGKELSYNNVADTDAALECVLSFDSPACVIVKHANPCGVAEGRSVFESYDRAFSTDPDSAFGGILAFNRDVDEALARNIIERQFVEVIIAPGYSPGALDALATKRNVRVLSGEGLAIAQAKQIVARCYKQVGGGLLVQSRDVELIDESYLNVVSKRSPSEAEQRDLIFAWNVAKFVKSNAIVYAKDLMTVGVGAGQMARVYSAKIAAMKAADANLLVAGSVMASDAFFPFRDSIDAAAEVGITAIIQPGGSIRDQEVIDAVDEAGIAMMFTGMRHFRH